MARYTPTWVVLMDGSRARILVQENRRARLTRAFGEGFTASRMPDAEEMHRAARSRAFAGALGPDAGDPGTEAREQAEHEFCVTLAGLIDRAVHDRQLERLIVVAPPRTLADLRASLSPQARARVHTEVARDWIDLPDAEIEGRLGGALLSPMATGA